MNEFINAHGDQIFNVVFISLMVIIFVVGIYAWFKIEKDHKAFLEYIRKNRQIGYLDVRGNQAVFVRTKPDGSPVDPNQ